MAKGKTGRYSTAASGILVAMILAGCQTPVAPPGPTIKTKSRTELDIEAVRADLLVKCRGLPPTPPENQVGALLDDGAEAMNLLAECMTRQHALVDYLAPVVAREKAKQP